MAREGRKMEVFTGPLGCRPVDQCSIYALSFSLVFFLQGHMSNYSHHGVVGSCRSDSPQCTAAVCLSLFFPIHPLPFSRHTF